MRILPWVGLEPTSPCFLVSNAIHNTIRDHHTGNVAEANGVKIHNNNLSGESFESKRSIVSPQMTCDADFILERSLLSDDMISWKPEWSHSGITSTETVFIGKQIQQDTLETE